MSPIVAGRRPPLDPATQVWYAEGRRVYAADGTLIRTTLTRAGAARAVRRHNAKL